jgi:hypothetical protein
LVLAAAEDREEPEQVEQEGEHRAGIVSGSALRDQPLAAGWLLAKDTFAAQVRRGALADNTLNTGDLVSVSVADVVYAP